MGWDGQTSAPAKCIWHRAGTWGSQRFCFQAARGERQNHVGGCCGRRLAKAPSAGPKGDVGFQDWKS